jgi:hypothetical protein
VRKSESLYSLFHMHLCCTFLIKAAGRGLCRHGGDIGRKEKHVGLWCVFSREENKENLCEGSVEISVPLVSSLH